MMRKGVPFVLAALALSACDDGANGTGVPQPSATAEQTTTASSAATSTASADVSAAPSADAPETGNGAKGPFPASTDPAMKDPSQAKLTAPDTFEGKFETTAGDFVIACTRAWAPHAADRLFNLLKIGFYDDVAIYRVHPGFVAQFGLHGDPAISGGWQKAQIEPDAIKQKNKKGTITFAQAGNPAQKGMTALTRATQIFINYADNEHLDEAFAPVCTVKEGFEVTKTFGGEKLHSHLKNAQGRILEKGNDFLRKTYPELDYIKKAYVLGDEPEEKKPPEAPKEEKAPKPGGKDAKGKLQPEP